jgi:two-component system response regulator FixJ
MPADPLVCVVDDDEAVLDSVALLLEVEGLKTRTFASAEALLDALPLPAACIISDVRMPGLDGIELLRALDTRRIEVPVIMITGHGDVPMAVRAMQRGAVDFLEKPFDPNMLISIVRKTLERNASPAAGGPEQDRLASLTPREHDVFAQLLTGRSNKEIGRALEISPRTVEVHRARVMEKMAAGSLAELVRLGLALGIVPARP